MFILSLCSKRRWPLSPAALILLLLPVAGLAQHNFTIKGCIKGLSFKKIYFEQLSSSNPVILDSAYTSNDCFQFQLTDTLAPGMYSIILNREYNSFIRILLNHEGNIEFSTNYMSMQDSIRFRGSVENTTYYSFLRYYNQSQLKNAQFQKMIEISEGDITVTNKLREAIAIKENNRIAHCLQLAKDHRGTIAADFINASTPIEVPALADSLSYQMDHLMDHLNFESNALFHSDLLLNSIINNLNLADKYSKNFNEMVENYLLVMDKVLEKSARNTDIYNFFRNRFRQWFTYGNMDVIATYNDKYYTEIPHPISVEIGRAHV